MSLSGAGLEWTGQGPRSVAFGDVYFSAVDGLAEARTVFLDGAGLPRRWGDRSRFVVAELGFGTGLNVAALLDLWRRTRPSAAHLSIFSIEAYPISRDDAARALAVWPELAEVAGPLLAGWPRGRRGRHRIDLPGLNATFDLHIGEAAEALAGWDGRADAWFLDGFAPARNPQMWRDEVLALVAARSAPGARAATFTVAGQVRRGLAAVGFDVARRPGFGRKRERLEATFAGAPPSASPLPRALILGAGVAGASLAWALRAQGVACTVLDAGGPGAGASGNPSALVTPRLDAGLGPVARLHAQAFARAGQVYRAADAVIAEGALQLEASARDAGRFDAIASWDGFDPGALSRLTPDQAGAALEDAREGGALRLWDALTVEPAAALRWLLEGAAPVRQPLRALVRDGSVWRALGPGREPLAEAEVVCLALGPGAAAFLPRARLSPVRGQLDWSEAVAFRGLPAAWGGYAIPTRDGGVLFGASHGRGDAACDLRTEDTLANLDQLAQGRPALARAVSALGAGALRARAATRLATPDHMPLAGAWPTAEDLHVLTGFGGRGFTLAPLLAEHVAAGVTGAPSPLPEDLARIVSPARWGDAFEPAPDSPG